MIQSIRQTKPAESPSAPAGENCENREVEALIVGAGLGGLATAISLQKSDIQDIVILEKAAAIGGTWRDNTYPGCACDVASVMYSYSFASAYNWTRMYPQQQEILHYIEDVADKFGVRSKIRFNTEARSYVFDESRDRWKVTTSTGTYFARVVVLAHGALHIPKPLQIPHANTFKGEILHTAAWNSNIDLADKRVAVIGTGSSAAQLIPAIAHSSKHVAAFQRSAHWVLPKPDRQLSEREQWLLKRVTPLRLLYRNFAYWSHELPIIGFKRPGLMKLAEGSARRHIASQITDPVLREKVTPNYVLGCKRILLSNDYYPALQRSNVDLITDSITKFVEDGIQCADGRIHKVDVVVNATGFDTENRCSNEVIVGRDGLPLKEAWAEGPEAYLGMAVSGFPNMFHIMGPNSGGGSQSILFVIEAQARYIAKCLRRLQQDGFTRMEVRADVQKTFNRNLHEKLARTVWNAGGCTSWFLDKTGMNRQSWPGTGTSYWQAVRRLKPADFVWTTGPDCIDSHSDSNPGAAQRRTDFVETR